MKRLLLIVALCAAAHASASGGYSPNYTHYKAYTSPDIKGGNFQAGQLGVLQPGMQRVYLYTAWRAVTLGPKVKKSPGLDGGLARADGSAFDNGWDTGAVAPPSKDDWMLATGLPDTALGHCPSAAISFASATLKELVKRKDASPARVKQWADAQELVWLACKAASDARYMNKDVLLKVVLPAALGDGEPAYWRQLRDYQHAAALFHAERYAEASAQFTQIGATADHPMRELGHYLALRAEVRLALQPGVKFDQAQRERAYAALEQRAQAIVKDASLAAHHEDARATLRSARVYLTPQTAFADLNRYLADPARDPFVDDRLGDWAVLMRLEGDYPDLHVSAAREQVDFIDWIENLRECGYPDPKDKTCAVPAKHALSQWQKLKSRPWLAASMMTALAMPPEVEKAALAVKPADPEYVTVRYHLARLYRLAGRHDEARAVADAALKLTLSNASRNLFREERFAMATSVADAVPFMLRSDIDSAPGSENPAQGFNDDVLDWLANHLGAADMIALARQPVLEAPMRARLASAAWMRAELVGKHAIALQALDVLEPLAPVLKAQIASYRKASTPAEQRHRMLLTALRFGLAPSMNESSAPIAEIDKGDVAASNWCSFKPASGEGDKPFAWLLPPPPAVGERDAAKAELAQLVPLKTATGFIGEHVLARVKTNPADPDLPWLLHVVVASTRGGCLDANARQLSRDAFNVLHKRFPRDEWTRNTPYFY